jgi:hypothetical protein
MPRIATHKLRTLAERVRSGLDDIDLDDDLKGDLAELCLLAERAAAIEEARVASSLTDSESSSGLLLDSFAELEKRRAAKDQRLLELQDYAAARGGDFAAGVGAVFLMLEGDSDEPAHLS